VTTTTRTEPKVALVTGAGSGLGRAGALALLDAGWSLVLTGRRKEALDETAQLSSAPRSRILGAPADIRDPEQVDALFDAVRQHYGRLDLLVNNAGARTPRMPVPEVRLDDWNLVMETVATGAFLCARAAFRLMRDQEPGGGRIINNGAPSAHTPRPDSVAYTAAKHALLGLTKALTLDGRRYGITCGQIDVGNVAPFDGSPQPPALQADGTRAVEDTVPAERFTEALLFMASMPPDSTVQFLTVLPATMPFVGRG
jgi:NAD(P)-dependent dehydrogenase (short-subunit alcohol dehydrogenase family)